MKDIYNAQCPFFYRKSQLCIYCQAIPDSETLIVRFDGEHPKGKKAAYYKRFCCKGYSDCRYYKLLEKVT